MPEEKPRTKRTPEEDAQIPEWLKELERQTNKRLAEALPSFNQVLVETQEKKKDA